MDEILNRVGAFLRRFVVMTEAQRDAVALWVLHTHLIDAADCTPILHVTSATKQSGKTRLLEVLEQLVARPWLTGKSTTSALMRKVDAERPTLLLDEVDAALSGDPEYVQALRGLLNAGYRRSGKHTVCVGQGAKIEARDFAVFSPKAIAGIGDLPDTVADRSIPVVLQRRTGDEPVERWRERDGRAQSAPLRESIEAWIQQHGQSAIEFLRDARPDLPHALGDRQQDIWEPLFSLAAVAGDAWQQRAHRAAVTLSGSREDSDVSVQLLDDIDDVVADFAGAVIPTHALIARLTEREHRQWATWKNERPITPHALARLLKPLLVHPVATPSVRGYRTDAFASAVGRYLPFKASHRHSPFESASEPRVSSVSDGQSPDVSETEVSAMNPELDDASAVFSEGPGYGDVV